jgi:hypothetical protein
MKSKFEDGIIWIHISRWNEVNEIIHFMLPQKARISGQFAYRYVEHINDYMIYHVPTGERICRQTGKVLTEKTVIEFNRHELVEGSSYYIKNGGSLENLAWDMLAEERI